MTFEEIMSKIPVGAFVNRGKFAAKLSFAQRCEILAFYHNGVSRQHLADAFGIDRRTVTHIQNAQSKHYRDVRAEYKKLGHDAFLRQYVTEAGALKIAKVVEGKNLIEGVPRKAANKCRGAHNIKTEFMEHSHRIMIEWQDAGTIGPGWYYQDLDGPTPDQWFHNGADSTMTSNACLQAVKENITEI